MTKPDVLVVIAPDAIEQLAAYTAQRGWRDVLVVADANTREAVGERVVEAVSGAREHVFEQCSGLRAGLAEVDAVRARLAGAEMLIAAGSGVITDIVRHAAFQTDLPFVSVPSAASVDGYASSVAALEIEDVKVTLPAHMPAAIFSDPRVCAAAPAELTRAGVGDLLGKATSRVDWLAAPLLYGEPFSEEIDARVLAMLRKTARNTAAALLGAEVEIGALIDGLIQSGIAIALAGSSRPASGSEHHASHFWDLLAVHGRREHALHGLQVAYATRFAMRLHRFAFAGGVVVLRPPMAPVDPLGRGAREWLGKPTAEIVAAVQEKERFAAVLDKWPSDGPAWAAVQARLAPSIGMFAEVERALDIAGVPTRPGYLGIDLPTLTATFRYANRLRARYTVIDFLEGQGVLEEAIGAALRLRQ